MTKVKFNKAEKNFSKAMQMMFRDSLINLSDDLTKKEKAKGSITKEKKLKTLQNRKKVLKKMRMEFGYFIKKNKNLYKKVGTTKEEMDAFFENPEKISAKNWKKIKEINTSLKKYIKKRNQTSTEEENETVVKSERKNHINKRHNVRDTWLPL